MSIVPLRIETCQDCGVETHDFYDQPVQRHRNSREIRCATCYEVAVRRATREETEGEKTRHVTGAMTK